MKRSDALKAKYLEIVNQLKALNEKATGGETKELSTEDSAEFDRLTAEAERLFDEYTKAVRGEKTLAAAESVPALDPVDKDGNGDRDTGKSGERRKAEARPDKKMDAGQKISLVAASVFKSKALRHFDDITKSPYELLADDGYPGFALELTEARNKSVNTLTSGAGGVLLPTPLAGEVIPLLRPQSTFLSNGPRRVQLTAGQFNQPRGATGATAGYVGELAKKPVSEPTFDSIAMRAKKLAGIVILSKEARRWAINAIEEYIRADLTAAMAQTMDLQAYLGVGSSTAPTGILNISGVGVVTPTVAYVDPKNPTLPELDAISTKMILYMTTRNIARTGGWRWLMNDRTLSYLENIRVNNNGGERAFPELQGNAPTWKRIPVVTTNQFPINLGSGTDESILALVNFDDVLFGDEEDITLDMSAEATIDVSGTLVHLFQQNAVAILAEMMHDFGLRRLASVVRSNAIRWGA